MKICSSWDDGRDLDLVLANVLKRYNMPGMFYIPTDYHKWGDSLGKDDIKKLVSMGFEIGAHTTTHPQDIKELNYEEQFIEIDSNKKWLEEVTGKQVTSFCYPSGKYNEETKQIVKALGFEEARTVDVLNTSLPVDKLVTKTTFHFHPNRVEYKDKGNWLDLAWSLYQEAKSKGDDGYFHLWSHSWELSKYKLWDDLEYLLKRISEDYNK
jgi:peptidoglycan-N-acetylglucosamine deacetylase